MKTKKDKIYLKTLRSVDNTIFCVNNGQKTYFDKISGYYLPYSSGQQQKYSLFETIGEYIEEKEAILNIHFNIKDGEAEQKGITHPCDPDFYDQLLRGYMKANKKNENDDNKDIVVTRRSPFSISALTPIHGAFAGTTEDQIISDRTGKNDNLIISKDNKKLSEEEIDKFISNNGINLKQFIPVKQKLINGLFKSLMVIDLNKLFRVSIFKNKREVDKNIENKLKGLNWKLSDDENFLVLTEEKIRKYTDAIVEAIYDYRITSNQSRALDLMPILSTVISYTGHHVNQTYIVDTIDKNDDSDYKFENSKIIIPYYGENKYDTKTYSTYNLKSISHLIENVNEIRDTIDLHAIENAKNDLKNRIFEFYNIKN